MSVFEYLFRFECRCKEVSNNDFFKLRLLVSFLTGIVFNWYVFLLFKLRSVILSVRGNIQEKKSSSILTGLRGLDLGFILVYLK